MKHIIKKNERDNNKKNDYNEMKHIHHYDDNNVVNAF